MNDKPLAVFDLDGTLYKTENVSVAAVHTAMADLGMRPGSGDEIKSLFGGNSREFCERLAPGSDERTIAAFMERLRYHERRMIPGQGELYAGATGVLHALAADGWSLAVCSNGSEGYVDTVLGSLGIKAFFDDVRCNDGTGTKSDHLRAIMTRCNGPVVMVGDKAYDIRAAQDNAVPSIGVAWGYAVDGELEDATYSARDMAELRGILAQCRLFGALLHELRGPGKVAGRGRIIGINGVDASGKTRFSDGFGRYCRAAGIKVCTVHIDDFHNPAKTRSRVGTEIDAYIANAFDYGKLEATILKPFREQGAINTELELLNLETDHYDAAKRYEADADTVLVLEGTLLFREPVDRYLDYRVFLDVSFDEVKRRAQVRDVPRFGSGIMRKYEEKYIPIQQWYLSEKRPKERADMVIDNNDYLRPFIVR